MVKLPVVLLLTWAYSHQIMELNAKSLLAAQTEEKTNHNSTPEIYQMRIMSKITNRFVHTTVLSKIKNVANTSQEAVFSIVIPDTAFISGFVMDINGKNYTAYVKEKEEARKSYDTAVAGGQSAAHVAVSVRDSNRFTVSVNMEAETKAIFYLMYEELLHRRNNYYELLINLHPGQPVKHLSVEVSISESRKIINVRAPPLRSGRQINDDNSGLDPRADITLIDEKHARVIFRPNLEQQSRLGALLKAKQGEGLSGQFVVQYEVERDPSGGEVLLQDGYFVHFFAPNELQPFPKHVVFILDTSSSMYGDKIVQLREAMLKILEQLNEQDKFSLVEFNTKVKVWDLNRNDKSVWIPPMGDNVSYNNSDPDISNFSFPQAYPVNVETIAKAKQAISTLTPTAATDIYTALKTGLHLVELANDNIHQPMIIFLTDGDPTIRVTSTETIVTKITEYNSGPRKSAIFTVSFGDDADEAFMTKLAARNRGFSRHIYEAADASLQLQNFYKEISSPILTNVTFNYGSSVTNLTESTFPIHFGGSELVVTGFCGTSDLVPPTVDGFSNSGWIRLRPKFVRPVTSTERLWAYLTVKQLLQQKEHSEKEQAVLKKRALELALRYEFVTPVSSLVVIKPNSTDEVEPEVLGKKNFGVNIVQHYSLAPSSNNSNAIFPHKFSNSEDDEADTANTVHDFQPTRDLHTFTPRTPFLNELPKSDIFSIMPWLNDVLEDGFLRLRKGVFKLGLNETISEDTPCLKTPISDAGYCSLLNECKPILTMLTSRDVYEQYFCVLLDEYAGVCCPDLP